MDTVIILVVLVFIFFLLSAFREVAETAAQAISIWAKNQKIDNQKDITKTIKRLEDSLDTYGGWHDLDELAEIIEQHESESKPDQ